MKHLKLFFALFAMLALGVTNAWAQTVKWEKATSIAAGDVVVLVCESKTMELSGISTTSTKYGTGETYTSTPAGKYELTVEAGSSSGTFSFKNGSDYLCWYSGNSLNKTTTKNENASWKVTFSSGNATILNAQDNTRNLQWNASSPRFACYTGAQTAVQLYKKVISDEPADVIVKTLKSIAVEGATTNYETGDMFKFDGTCTATYAVTKNDVAQEDETKVVTPTSISTPDMTTAGEKEVTVEYTEDEVTVTATYTINVTENEITEGEYELALNNTFFGTTAGVNVSAFPTTAKQDDIIVTLNGEGTKTRTDADCVRMYDKNTLTFSVPAGYVITSITFAEPSSSTKWDGSITVNVGSYTDGTKTWAGSAQEVVFSFGAQNRIATATVTYAEAGDTPEVPTLDAPTFDLEEGTYNEAKEVILSAEEGTIYYTLDGTTPDAESIEYTTPIVLNECGEITIKAIAISGEITSSVASATYTIKLPLDNSQEKPYTEQEAIEVYNGGCYDNQEVYVKGVVANAQFYSSNTYTITLEGGFQFYKFYEAAGEVTFTEDYIVAGDTLVACGKLVKYGETYELGAGCYLVERKPYSAPKVDISNTKETAYTVAQAIALIDNVTSDLTKQVYVKGEISKIDSYNATYGSITYWIKDEEGNTFQCYSGLGLNSEEFESVDDLVVGSQVVVYGTLKKHNSTYEFNYNNYIVSLTLPSYTVTATAENGTIDGLAADGKYEHGDKATLTAIPAEGYEFVNWTKGEEVVSTENPYKFTVTADVALVANFIKKTISYELNGGELPTVTVPTQDSLIAAFKDGYNAYFGVSVATTRTIDNFLYAGAAVNDPTCDVSLFMKDDASPWKWLGDYVLAVTNAQIEAGLLVNLKELATELMWRQSLTGFFLQQAQSDSNYKGNANFTEAGKPEAWGSAYQAAHAVVLPTEPVAEDYVLPAPTKEGYKFVGWYDNAEGTDEAMTVIPAGWDGTLYAIWVEIHTITVEAENGTVEGAGQYEHGVEATLTATAAEGYEFVNWTVGEDVVAETAEYTFTVTADVALVANFEVALPGTVALSCTGMNKMYIAMRDMLQLEGTSADDKDVKVTLYNYKATVGDYQAFITFGDLELETESLTITRGSDEWTLAATIDADTAIYEFTATTAAPKTETIAPHAATWGGDAMNGYIIDCTTTIGTVQIGLMDGTEYGMGWMLSLSINDELLVESATIDAPTWEEDNLVLNVTVVSGTLDEYTIQLTATPKPAIEVIANATMALSEDEYEVGTMIVSATWNEHPLTVKLNGWPYYGYGEYAEANLVIEIDPENYDIVDAYSTATLEKKEDVAVLTGTFSHWDGNKYALTLTIAEPAAAPVVDTVTVVCTDMEQGEEWGTPVLTGTCNLGDINISLNLEDTDHPESVYGEYGFAEYPTGLFPSLEAMIEGEESVILLQLMENTVAVYTDGETQDSFVGTFLGSDWKVYVLDMKTPAPENPSALDNVTTTVAPIKMIENGQLMIIKNGVQYNAQGAVIK